MNIQQEGIRQKDYAIFDMLADINLRRKKFHLTKRDLKGLKKEIGD